MGKVVWIGLALTYRLLLRNSEVFAKKVGKVHDVYCSRRRYVVFFEKRVQLGTKRGEAADMVENRFKGGKRDQGEKWCGSRENKRNRGGWGRAGRERSGHDGGAGGLLEKMVPRGENAPVMTYRSGGRWRVSTKGQATVCVRSGLERVGTKWRERGKGAVGELGPDELALHSGWIMGATRLAEMGAQPWVILREGRRTLQTLTVCVRLNMEDLLWGSRILVARPVVPSGQQGQGTRWAGKG